MVWKGFISNTYFILIVIGLLASCRQAPETLSGYAVNVRLPSEPENLNPMLSKSSYGSQITSLIMLPAAEFDPITLQLTPLLITKVPLGEDVNEGKHAGGKLYRMEFRPEAVWDNGTPVTAKDYLFTLKTTFNPYITSAGWSSQLSFLSEIVLSETDPRFVDVYIDSSYILSLEVVTNFNIYPEYLYDPEHIMSQFSYEELRDPNTKWTPQQDSLLKAFAETFQSPLFLREVVEGSGPYKFVEWTTGEFITLERKENWWGDKVNDAPLLLQAYPQSITYHIITDAAAAQAALKSGQVDVISEIPPASFIQFKNDPEWKDKFQFESPALLQVYYLELNNRNPVLADRNIRKALAYAIDYDGIMNNLLVGLGTRTVGPIHPSRSYYHKNLQPVKQDINRSISLIKEAGWKDTNGNGTADKVIKGKLQELSITLKIPNKEEGQMLANIVRENARKAGIDVIIETLDPSAFNQDIRQFNFDMAPVRARFYPSVDEPYLAWHSASDQAGGGNRSGFHHDAADEVIMNIRTAGNIAERDSGYLELQEIIYEEQPAIFLYVPLERIIISKKYKIISSSRKPGYFENLFRLAG